MKKNLLIVVGVLIVMSGCATTRPDGELLKLTQASYEDAGYAIKKDAYQKQQYEAAVKAAKKEGEEEPKAPVSAADARDWATLADLLSQKARVAQAHGAIVAESNDAQTDMLDSNIELVGKFIAAPVLGAILVWKTYKEGEYYDARPNLERDWMRSNQKVAQTCATKTVKVEETYTGGAKEITTISQATTQETGEVSQNANPVQTVEGDALSMVAEGDKLEISQKQEGDALSMVAEGDKLEISQKQEGDALSMVAEGDKLEISQKQEGASVENHVAGGNGYGGSGGSGSASIGDVTSKSQSKSKSAATAAEEEPIDDNTPRPCGQVGGCK